MPKDEAIKLMTERDEPYKVEMIKEHGDDETLSFYQQGDFIEFCAGPHLMSTKGRSRHLSLLLPQELIGEAMRRTRC